MGRLKQLPPRTAVLRPRLQFATDKHGHSKEAEPWRKWYGTPRWKALRWSILERDLFTCQRQGCGRVLGHKTHLLVADHKVAHHGDADLFWDEKQIACICKACHDSDRQREDRRGW